MSPPSVKPVLHYLDIGSLGRGEVVRQVSFPSYQPGQANADFVISLFFKDAGIAFQDERYPYDDTWAAASKDLQARGLSKTGKVPVLEYNGEILTQVPPLYLQSHHI